MIQREQLAAALARLDPRDREVLGLSLRRRVPDDALARVYGVEVPDVARRRAAAIERLAAELGVQRGQDLGMVLQALLDAETWEGVPMDDEPRGEGGEPSEAAPTPPDTEEFEALPDESEPEAQTEPEADQTEPEVEPVEPPLGAVEAFESRAEHPLRPELVEPPLTGPPEGPVLEMLTEPRPDDGEPPRADGERRRSAGRRLSAALAAAATVLLPAGGIVAAASLDGDPAGDGTGTGSQTRTFVPQKEGALAVPFPSSPTSASGYPVAQIKRSTLLYDAPGGQPKVRIPGRSEWGSARVLGVVRQEGNWLAVQVPELRNGEVGWVEVSTVRVASVPWSLHVDLSDYELTVRRDGHAVRTMSIAIGSSRHPTPTGRFSVTDKLRVADSGSPYGCCVLALSGHQTRLPEGWPGGDRLAVHATSDATSIGRPVSLGCMRAETSEARWLMRKIPLATPIFIRA
jgi:hypothetical protein